MDKKQLPKTIVIDSPSKRLFTNNMKIGLVHAGIEVIEILRELSDSHIGNITGLQVAFAKSLFKRENKQYIENICKVNIKNAIETFQDIHSMTNSSNKILLAKPDTGFHAILYAKSQISRNIDSTNVCKRIITNYETLAIPTNDFGYDLDDDFGIRLNLMASLIKSKHIIKKFAEEGILL